MSGYRKSSTSFSLPSSQCPSVFLKMVIFENMNVWRGMLVFIKNIIVQYFQMAVWNGYSITVLLHIYYYS